MKGWDSQTVAGKLIVAGMPMYNEEETIGTVVTMALKHVDAIICIDDEICHNIASQFKKKYKSNLIKISIKKNNRWYFP